MRNKIPFITDSEDLEKLFPENTEFRVYRNLHKDCYSIQTRVDGKWKLSAHVETCFLLKNVRFAVSAKTRDKVRKLKKKFVHAYVIGAFMHYSKIILGYNLNATLNIPVTYNPYRDDTFVNAKDFNQPISASKYCFLDIQKHERSLEYPNKPIIWI
mgnify:CR=1 FL=1